MKPVSLIKLYHQNLEASTIFYIFHYLSNSRSRFLCKPSNHTAASKTAAPTVKCAPEAEIFLFIVEPRDDLCYTIDDTAKTGVLPL